MAFPSFNRIIKIQPLEVTMADFVWKWKQSEWINEVNPDAAEEECGGGGRLLKGQNDS